MIQPVDYLTKIDTPPDISKEADIPELGRWLDAFVQQLNDLLFAHGYAINQLGVGVLPYAQLTKQLSAPLGPQIGWVVYADGTSWDPGSGEGLYVYKSDATWHFIV